MSHKDAPPETRVQRECREWWQAYMKPWATVGWGRDRNGKFLSAFAQDAEAAWQAAQTAAGVVCDE